jgi:hypothetical protein
MKTSQLLFLLLLLPLLARGSGRAAPAAADPEALPSVAQAATMSVAKIASVINGVGYTAATSTVTNTANAQNIYVAIRADHAVGAGTQSNPYDGGTEAHFDTVIKNLWSLNSSTPIIVHLAAGTYTITPVRQVVTTANPGGIVSNINGDVTLVGAGESKTTVRAGIVTSPNSTYYVFYEIGPNGGTSFENLTIDCNTQNQTQANVTIDGVSSNNWGGPLTTLAENIRVINGGNAPGQNGDSEWFGITIHDYRDDANAVISHCLVDNYQGGAGCTAISATTAITDNLVVLNNNDPYDLTGSGGGGGYQNAYSAAHLVEDNVCRNCTFGIYSDLGTCSDFTIENNWFYSLYEGICMYNSSATATLTNFTIQDNVILKTYMQAITLGNNATTPVNTNLTITDNVLDSPDVAGSARVNQPFAIVAAADVTITGNTISTSTHNNYPLPTAGTFQHSNLSTFTWSGNKYEPEGGLMPAPAGVPAQ